MNSDIWQFKNNICRCCHGEGYFYNLAEPRPFCGEMEVYSDMIKDIFNIEMRPVPGPLCEITYTICMPCILKLREAIQFKKQVQSCEERFIDLYLKKKLKVIEKQDVEKSIVKEESNLEFKDEYLVLEDDVDSNNDEEPDFDDVCVDVHDLKIEKELEMSTKKGKGKRKRKSEESKDMAEPAFKKKAEAKKVPEKKKGAPATKRAQHDIDDEVVVLLVQKSNRTQKETIKRRVRKTVRKTPSDRDILKSNLDKHHNNITQILTCTNATPIRNIGDFGYSCCYCMGNFPTTSELKKHTLENHEDLKNACFSVKKDTNALFLKLDITGLSCKLCNNEFDSVDDIFEHLRHIHKRTIHTDIKNQIVPFKFDTDKITCCICQNVYDKFRTLVQHMKEHYRNFVCEFCDKGFVNKSQLLFHLRNHEKGSFKCDECDKVYDRLPKLQYHVRMIHNRKDGVYRCSKCNITLNNYRQKLVHMKDVHGIYDEFKCLACDRVFWEKRSLAIHRRSYHLMEKRVKCSLCDMNFYSTSTLNKHMLKHTGERTYKCDICQKKYGRKTTLKQHMRIHADDRRFKCELCGQTFVQKCSWRSHMRSKHDEVV